MDAFCLLFTDIFGEGNIGSISENRSFASLPFGARYRLIDFILSSLVNASVPDIGVIAGNNYHSLVDHLGSGRDWDLNRKHGGLRILTPDADSISFKQNRFLALNSIKRYILKVVSEYCIIADSNIVFNIDFTKVFEEHISKDADITVVCHRALPTYGDLEISCDDTGKINDVLFISSDRRKESLVSTNIYILKKEFLLLLMDKALTYGWSDFGLDVIARGFTTYKLNVYIHRDYCSVIKNLKTYYQTNMDLLNNDIRNMIFKSGKRVLTKSKDSVPVNFGEFSSVSNSLIADGCKIEGHVENSIVFRDVHIKKGAVIKNSIVIQGTTINENSNLSYVILDKNIVVTEGKSLNGCESFPFVVSKGVVV